MLLLPRYMIIIVSSAILIACSPTLSLQHKQPAKTENPINQSLNGSTEFPITLAPLKQWQTQHFAKKTLYSIHSIDGIDTLKANSEQSASLLYKPVNVNLTQTPYLRWQWKSDATYTHTNEAKRAGDDYVLRVYIGLKPKPPSIYPRALVYVWASHAEPLSSWENPYNSNTIMVALRSEKHVDEQTQNHWTTEHRNIQEDLKFYLGEDIEQIEGIGIMTDSDNTQQQSMSYYREFYFSSQAINQ